MSTTAPLMSIDDVAAHLNIRKSRLYDCYRSWGIPFVKVGQAVRFRPEDVEAWINSQRESA